MDPSTLPTTLPSTMPSEYQHRFQQLIRHLFHRLHVDNSTFTSVSGCDVVDIRLPQRYALAVFYQITGDGDGTWINSNSWIDSNIN